MSVKCLLLTRRGETQAQCNHFPFFEVCSIDPCPHVLNSFPLWITFLNFKRFCFWEYCSPVNVESIKMKCVCNYCVQRCDIYVPIPSAFRIWNVTKSATNRYQSISINLSIVIENRYQSITTRIFAIDWSSIININRLIDIDWYRLISIVIDYRFHRLDTPGLCKKNFKFKV